MLRPRSRRRIAPSRVKNNSQQMLPVDTTKGHLWLNLSDQTPRELNFKMDTSSSSYNAAEF